MRSNITSLDQRPRIRIVLVQQANEDSLAIEDEGIGFSNAHRDDIFQPFRRLHDRNDVPGTGIGLAICKAIASRHGWLHFRDLDARSSARPSGSFSQKAFGDAAAPA